MKYGIVLALLLVAALLPAAAAVAQEDDETSRQDAHWKEKPSVGEWNINAGLMLFNSKNYKAVYGSKPTGFYDMNGGVKVVHQLEVIASIGFATSTGHGVSPTDKQATSEKYLLDFAPAGLGLAYRFNFVYDQPVAPYLGGEAQLAYWYETRLHSGWKTRSWNTGYCGFGGVMFLLNNIEKRASGLMKSQWGINNTYFFYEYRYSSLNNFNHKNIIDLSSQAHQFGFMLEF